jgi:hypothetical protein
MIFKLNLRIDNAAFGEGSRDYELARILREIADKIEAGQDYATYKTVFDVNGNDVGRYARKNDDGSTPND